MSAYARYKHFKAIVCMYSTMKKELYAGTVAFMFLFLVTYTTSVNAQNVTTNASNAVGNASASINQTASELGKNASSALNNAGASANATMSEVGKNASDTGETLLNQTGEVAKKIVGGAANVLSNISGEIKQGVGAK
jgi:type IV secretory pathway TrbL component